MGWGLLFFGYVLKYVLGLNPMFDVVLTLPACLFMVFGLKRLSLYCHTFRYAVWSVAPVAAVSLGGVIGALALPVAELPASGASAADWLGYLAKASTAGWLNFADAAAMLVFHVALAIAVKELAMRVDVRKNAVRALRNLVIVGLYTVCFLMAETFPALTAVMSPTALLIRLVFVICNSVLLYSCYMRIAPAEQTEAPRRPSRFAWVNRLRDAYEQKTQKAIDADRAYHEKNLRERREKQLARMSKKQREKETLRQKRNK